MTSIMICRFSAQRVWHIFSLPPLLPKPAIYIKTDTRRFVLVGPWFVCFYYTYNVFSFFNSSLVRVATHMIEFRHSTNLISILSIREGSKLHQMSRKLAHQPVEIKIDTFGQFFRWFFFCFIIHVVNWKCTVLLQLLRSAYLNNPTIRQHFVQFCSFNLYYFARNFTASQRFTHNTYIYMRN